MRHASLYTIARLGLGAALVSCVGTDAITRPDLKSSQGEGVPVAGALSRYSPEPGALSPTTPPTFKSVRPPLEASPSASAAALATGPAVRLLWQNTVTGDRSIWVMDGTNYTGVLLPNVPTAWSIAGAGDFNADGHADIVWQNLTTGERSIWFMNGNTYSSAALLPNVPIQWSIAGVGDFNNDGKPDLVWQNTATGDRSIWYMNGAAYASAALLPNVSTAWKIAAVGDFNDDGSPDLVWQKASTGESSIWFMNGATYSGEFALLMTVPLPWRIAGAIDFSGDGFPDLVWQNINTGERSLWMMNGPTFVSSAMLPTVPIQWVISGVMKPALTTGAVKIFTVTTGAALDATGYTIELCCKHTSIGDVAMITDIGINTFGGFSNLAPGTYTVTLGAIASNCSTTNNPRTVTVSVGAVTETTFNVTCVAGTTGSIKVTTITTGASLDPNGYTVTTSKTINLPIGINSSTTITGFTPGTQSVQLGGIASNCSTTDNPRNVTVTAGATTETTFNVSCVLVPTATRFQNNTVYPVVYLTIDGVQQIGTGFGILPGNYYEKELPAGTHNYEARTGGWDGSIRTDYYVYTGTFTQQAGTTGTIVIPNITINQLLTQFGTRGRWRGYYYNTTNCSFGCEKIFTFNSGGTWTLTDRGVSAGSGTYSEISRVPFIIDFRVGTATSQKGTYFETGQYFVMGNGPADWVNIEYYYIGP